MREKQINVRIVPLAIFLAAVMFLSLHLPSARAQHPAIGNEANEPDYGNDTDQGEEAGPDEPYDPEREEQIRHRHVLAILNLYYKAAREQRRKFVNGEYEEAFAENDAAGRALDKNPGSPEASAAKRKALERWEKAHHEYDKMVVEENHAESDAEDEYRKLPPSLRKALEDPLHHTPTFSGLPDADKLREAYEYSRAKAEEQQKAEAEERHPGGQKEQAPAPAPQDEEERQPIGMLAPSLKATVVGIVEARSGNPGELASLSVVTDPDDLEGTPGLLVKKVTIPLPRDRHGRASLNGVVVRPAHGTPQPAGEPVTYTVPSGSSMPVSITLAETATSLAEVTVPLAQETNPHERSSDFTMLPVMPDSGIALVHGPFHGDASKTRIAVNGEPAKVLAETAREVFFEPHHLRDGHNNVTVSEGLRTASLAFVAPKLAIGAAKTMLSENESTDIKVTVSALNDLPESAWKSGTPAELYDPAAWSGARNSGMNGKLLLTIKNDSPDVVMMAGATGNTVTIPLSREDLNNGTYEWTGSVTARRAGSFNLEATIVPLLAEVGAAESPISAAARQTDEKSAERERRPKSPDEPKDENSEGETVVEGGGGIPVGMPTPTIAGPPQNPENPVPVTPDKNKDCPQRGLGCAVLVIDILGVREGNNEANSEEKAALNKLVAKLGKKGLGCDVDEVVANFQNIPLVAVEKVVDRKEINGHNRPIIKVHNLYPNDDETKEKEKHNIEEWKKIAAAIANHREKVKKGKEIAIEIIDGHGAHGSPGTETGKKGSACGNWGPGVELGYYTPQEKSLSQPEGDAENYTEPLFAMWRDEFHEGNYQAANHHVCDWIVYDFSCYSGLTSMAIDELENRGAPATCTQKSIVNCSSHAGWELDSASGTSVCTKKSSSQDVTLATVELSGIANNASSVEELGQMLGKAMDNKIKEENEKAAKGESGSANSYYMDRGYKKDPDPTPPKEHPHGGY